MNGEAHFVEETALDRRLIRILLPAAVLLIEALAASLFLDGETLRQRDSVLGHFIAQWGAWIVRGIIGFAALFATFGYLRHRVTLVRIAMEASTTPIHRPLLALHGVSIAIFAALSTALYSRTIEWLSFDMLAILWALSAVAATASAVFAVAPYRHWADLVASTGLLWLQAMVASAAACVAGAMSWALWPPATRLTYSLVKLFLSPFVTDMQVQPERMRIGTSRFAVAIAPECSGLEGAGLLIVFAIVWMILFRHEVRFPHSLILVPAGVLILFFLNSARIATLILIGNAGARDVAVGGFHSQAGWIAFNSVAFGLAVAARRLPWFSVDQRAHQIQHGSAEMENPTAAYLLPFLAIIAAGMISQAMSGGFEWVYSLRLFAALITLWLLRRSYSSVDWRCGWLGVAIGIAVFALWIAMEPLVKPTAERIGMPAALASASALVQACWIVLRTLGAVVAAPVAEELAFRGFAMRRLMGSHFEEISYLRVHSVAIAISSVLFGLMHGDRWLAGTMAGVMYAFAAKRSGRLGDAVLAHATTNALLAGYVLATGTWHLW